MRHKNHKRYPRELVCTNSSCKRAGKPIKVGRYLGGVPYTCGTCRKNSATVQRLIKEQKSEQEKERSRADAEL